MNKTSRIFLLSASAALVLVSTTSQAAIALDRTRIIFNNAQKSVSLSINNENKQLPYLAQAWIEDVQGNKIQEPLTVLPPLQRIEPGEKSQLKIQSLPSIYALPQDRETLYYFNMREIPPRSDKPNTLQLALQTRIKLFFRPKSLIVEKNALPWQEKITLIRKGDKYQVSNPTPYYVTLIEGRSSVGGKPANDFQPLMIEPQGQAMLKSSVGTLGNSPVLTYINDYGGRPELKFTCHGLSCTAAPVKTR